MTIFFTADTHFYHKNVIKYCNRPFCSVEQMNECMIERWNTMVSPKDTVYHLGDFGFANASLLAAIRSKLNGAIFLVIGNHDVGKSKKKWLDQVGINEVHDWLDFQEFHLSHLPELRDEDRKVDRSKESSKYFAKHCTVCDDRWRLCGHVHDAWKIKGKQINVGVDVWDFTPISIELVREKIYENHL